MPVFHGSGGDVFTEAQWAALHRIADTPAIEEVQRPDGTVEVLRDDRRSLMPESPDFDTIADAILSGPGFRRASFGQVHVRAIATQLRLAWNGRGDADLIVMETYLSSVLGVSGAGPHVKNLERAVKAIDR